MAPKQSGSPDDLMEAKAMKPILSLAKRGNPVYFAFCLTDDKEAVLVVDKKKKPKKLSTFVKAEAKKAGLGIAIPTMRFGTCSVEEGDAGLLVFTANKEVPNMMRAPILKRIKLAGFQQLEFTIDEGLENEPEEDEAEEGEQVAAPPRPAAQEDEPAPNAAAAPQDQTADAANPPAQQPEAVDAAAADVPPPPPQPEPAAPNAGAPANPMAQLTQALAKLMQQIPGYLSQAPSLKDTLIKLATEAKTAIQSGDADAATSAIEALKTALAAPPPAQSAAPAAGVAPASMAALAKTRIVWVAARGAVEKQLDTLHGKMADAYKDHGFGADLEKFFKAKVEPVLGNLDESLIELLDEVANAKEPGEQKKLIAQAQQVITKYEGYLASEPLIKQLDDNPFMPLQIEATLTKTLMALNTTISSIAGQLRT